MRFGLASGTVLPYGSLEQIMPHGLYMVYATALDDYYEFAEPEATVSAADRVHDLVLGAAPTESDHAIMRLISRAGQELRTLVPEDFVARYADTLREYLKRGVARENLFRRARIFPPVDTLLSIREYSIGALPSMDLMEAVLERPLPPAVAKHPVLQRLRILVARMAYLQNDILTAGREQDHVDEGEVMNTLLAVRHQWDLSLEQAHRYALQLNQQAIDEFAYLKDNLPDVGRDTELVETYVNLLACIAEGWMVWYKATLRYDPGGHPAPDWNL